MSRTICLFYSLFSPLHFVKSIEKNLKKLVPDGNFFTVYRHQFRCFCECDGLMNCLVHPWVLFLNCCVGPGLFCVGTPWNGSAKQRWAQLWTLCWSRGRGLGTGGKTGASGVTGGVAGEAWTGQLVLLSSTMVAAGATSWGLLFLGRIRRRENEMMHLWYSKWGNRWGGRE